MANVYAFTPQCLTALKEIRATYPSSRTTLLFRAMRQIADNPRLPGSGLSYHDPQQPDARFYRVPPLNSPLKLTIFYRVTAPGIVEFTNVWYSAP
jgi:hypothetical protein